MHNSYADDVGLYAPKKTVLAILLLCIITVLSDLPDETLERILEFVTSDRESLENVSLVNSRFNKIVFPLLVRQWNNSQECLEPSIERLALHLLRNPDLRRHVERLDLGYLRPLHDHDPDSADLSPESLAALANAAERDLEVSKFLSTHVCHRIRLGCEDAIAAFILAWCTRLTHLNITVPSFHPDSHQHFMPLLYVKEAVCRLLDGPAKMAPQLPLGQVRHVTLQPWNSEEVFDMAYARSFLHLPCIQKLCAYGLFDDLDNGSESDDNELPLTHLVDYVLPFPVSTSPITELTIVGCLRSGVPDFITACRSLRKLNIRVDYGLGIYGMPDQKELAEAVIKHKDSLEDLDLDISIMNFPNPDPVLEETYSQLSRIRTLAVHIADFFKGAWSKGVEDCVKVVLDRIPEDVQVLKPRSHRFIESWVSSSNDVFLEPYLEGIIELLEEAGPQGRFSKLRVLDLSEAVRPGTRHPESQHQAIVDGLRLMTCYPSLFTEIESSVWFNRGWTFQEAAFSKRIFFFTTSQTFFLCRETMYCEESVWEVPDGDSMAAWANTKTIEAGRIKDLMILRNSNGSYPEGGYYRSAEEYTKRTLCYPQDILHAWAAVIQWMEEDKKWGSTCSFGLPLDQFGFGLGWKPLHGHNPDPVNQRAGFPSWS
ncbi:hypothetical protein BFJ69_g10123 [Fusarium oxysporum]|uniref:F-box domain-containing protein n=1 Tax=Fusarium oxysporum TaxID=5507 RepID=A0A420MWN5_FUSOX|nr:hypothetical protein BFJ69_g10123 [Fusarium oxysporum]